MGRPIALPPRRPQVIQAPRRLAAPAPVPPRSLPWARALESPRGLAFGVAILVALVVLAPLGGLRYYSRTLSARILDPAHAFLRSSGLVGWALGVIGALLMLAMQIYSVRKRTRLLGERGSLKSWLDFHIFCGIVGPSMITLHTAMKFNGIVSVAYWCMVLVTLSGFVGRYLYVRIPKSLSGRELTHRELVARSEELRARLLETPLDPTMVREVQAFEAEVIPTAESASSLAGLVFGELVAKRRLGQLRAELHRSGLAGHLLDEAALLAAERSTVLRRIAYLKKTKRLFDMWHVFHRPLAGVMLAIVLLHIATVAYFGCALPAR